MTKWWRVVSLSTLCQFLCIIAVSNLPMPEKGVTMGENFGFYGVRWGNR